MLGFIFLFFRHEMINLTFIYIYISYPLRQYDFNGPSVLPCDACRRSSSCLPMAFEVILRVAKKIPEGTCSMEQITIRINYAVCYGMFIYILYMMWFLPAIACMQTEKGTSRSHHTSGNLQISTIRSQILTYGNDVMKSAAGIFLDLGI